MLGIQSGIKTLLIERDFFNRHIGKIVVDDRIKDTDLLFDVDRLVASLFQNFNYTLALR